MNFEHSFFIGLPPEKAWPLMLDIERIAPCVPGGQLQEIEGNEYRGTVKVRLGPITAQYTGTVVMEEADAAARRMVLNAKGRDVHGQGNANAKVVASLLPEGDGTRVQLATDLQISGKVAQLGKGVMQDVSGKLIQQFAETLERNVVPGEAANQPPPVPVSEPRTEQVVPTAPEAPASAPAAALAEPAIEPASQTTQGVPFTAPAEPERVIRRIDAREAEAVDLLTASRAAIGKRVGIGAAIILVAVVLSWLVWR